MALSVLRKPTSRRPYCTYRVEALSDLLCYFNEQHSNGDAVLFRGQSRNWPLVPKMNRVDIDEEEKRSDVERRMFDVFSRSSLSYLESQPVDQWETLALAQHHGLPTRLLDWTTNLLAAAWFCVASPAKTKRVNGVIWVYSPSECEYATPASRLGDPFSVSETLVFEPQHVTPRIRSQEGMFTIHPFDETRSLFRPFEGNANRHLEKLVVPAKWFYDIRYDLEACGTHAASLFPDLDGLARRITEANCYLGDEVWSNS